MSTARAEADGPQAMGVRGAIVAGFLVLLLFFGGLGGWAATAPLAGAAIASGAVNVDTNRKTVQHLEGGIVGAILVREGQRVAAGDVVLRLDATQPRGRIELLDEQVASAAAQMALIEEEITTVRYLLERGLTPKPRLLALERRQAELVGELGEYRAQLRVAHDVLARTEVRAPVDGTVVALQVHSVGGVIAAGEPLLDVVPGEERLIVEAKVDPVDIDVVQAGLHAEVRLLPFNLRDTPPVPGEVISISADSLKDERTGQTWYLARIVLDDAFLAGLDGVAPSPGMPVEVMIHTGERTPLEYFLEPIVRSFRRAFRES